MSVAPSRVYGSGFSSASPPSRSYGALTLDGVLTESVGEGDRVAASIPTDADALVVRGRFAGCFLR